MSNFEAQSHSLFSRCLRLATTITGSHPRLATGGWLDLTRQAFHLLDYSPLSGRTIPIVLIFFTPTFLPFGQEVSLAQRARSIPIFSILQIVKETIGVGVNEKAVLRFYQTALSFTSISIFPW